NKGPGKSFEILPPDGLDLWKGNPKETKSAAKQNRVQRHFRLLSFSLLLLFLGGIGGHFVWKAYHPHALLPDQSISSTTDSTPSPDVLSSALSLKHSQDSQDSAIRLAPAGVVPASLYASTLDSVRISLDEGRDTEAEAKLKTLPKEAFNDRQVQQFASVLWNNLGVIQRAKGTGLGMAAFKTALTIDPNQPNAYRNLGRLYIELKDPALTREFLERALSVVPDDPWLHLAMAEIFYNKDDLGSAVTHLDHAAELVGKYPEVQTSVKLLSAKFKGAQKSEQKLLDRHSSHFQVKFEGGDDYEIWSRVLEILEEAYQDIGRQLGHYPSKPITVVLLTKESFHSATGGPAWSDGLFDPVLGRIKIPTEGALTNQAWLTRVLRHEFVHALLHDQVGGRIGAIPTWLNEGLAMQFAGDPPPDIPELMRGEVQLIPLPYLEGPWGAFPQKVALVAYLEGNSATVYLIDRFSMEKVRELVRVLAGGQAIAAAMQDRLFFPYEEFQRRWIDNLNEKIRAKKI
ncbi:MAG TPA: tetratricopeptide repeat protein, partial [Nitrospirales bacterium]